MPIKPENRKHYQTPEWKAANARVRERAGRRCEWCQKPAGMNAQVLAPRYLWSPWVPSVLIHDEKGEIAQLTSEEFNAFNEQAVDVNCVLTVAHHPDPNPENLADGNLHLLCQRCHNRLDAPMRAVNAKKTREAKRAKVQPALSFEGATP